MKETILKHFQSVKEEIIESLDEAVTDGYTNDEIDILLDRLNEINSLIQNVTNSK